MRIQSKASESGLVSLRFLVLGALLVGEIWLFRRRFTTDTLIGSEEWWAPIVRSTRFAIPWALCVAGSLLLIGGTRLRGCFRELIGTSPGYRGWPQALAHPIALLVFFWLTGRLLDGGAIQGPLSFVWALLWTLSGALVLVCLAWVALPLRALGRFAAGTAWMFLAALPAGTLALIVLSYIAEDWPLSRELGLGTLWFSYVLLLPFLGKVNFDPAQERLGSQDFVVIITKYCSGYEGMSLFLIFFLVFLALWRERLRFPNALLLLPLGMAAVWVMNSFRIVVLILLGTYVSPEVALDGFHVNAGWPSICFVSFVFVAVSTRVPFFASRPITASAPNSVNPTAAYLTPLLAIVGTSMIAGAFTAEPQSLYPLRILAGSAFLWIFWREVELRFGRVGVPTLIGALAFAIWVALHYAIGVDPEAEDPMAWQAARSMLFLAPWWVFRILGSVVVVPLAEELAFRGFLIRRLASADFEAVTYHSFRWVPFIVSSILFGALHDAWIAGTVVGMLYAWASMRRGRLGDAVVAHGITNGLLAVFAAITGDWVIL